MAEKVKISAELNPDEMKMFNDFKGNASNAAGLRMMVHTVCDKKYIFPELMPKLLCLDQAIKKLRDELPEKYSSQFNEIIEAEGDVWQTLSR